MAHRFHPDKNIGLDTTEIMKMINKDTYRLEDQLCTNDASSEEERSEPASSSSKESTLPAKYTNDNEETPFKKTHTRPWT